jgi:CRP-like cAMP-binding protein
MLTMIEKVIFLKNVPFFQGMTISQLRALASISDEAQFAEGQTIFKEGEYGSTLYVVLTGQVAIQRQGQARRSVSITRLATLGPHEYFAEMAIFDNEPHVADAVALVTTALLLVRQEPLIALIRTQPDLALGLFKVLSLRLRQTNELLAERTQAKPKKLMDLYDKFSE